MYFSKTLWEKLLYAIANNHYKNEHLNLYYPLEDSHILKLSKALKKNTYLKSLILSTPENKSRLTKDAADYLSECPIQILDMPFCDKAVDYIIKNPNIKSLELGGSYSSIGIKGYEALMKSPYLEKLKFISLCRERRAYSYRDFFLNLAQNTTLESLALHIGPDVQEQDFFAFAMNNSLKTLDFSIAEPGLTEAQMYAFSQNQSIEYLDISGKSISVPAIKQLLAKPNLKKLGLFLKKFSPEVLKILGEHSTVKSLRILFGEKQTESYAKAFEALAQNPHIESLDFAFEGKGMKSEDFRPIAKSSSIRTLRLDDSSWFPENGPLDLNLAQVLSKNESIEDLNLTYSFLKDKGFAALLEMPKLRKLNLSHASEKFGIDTLWTLAKNETLEEINLEDGLMKLIEDIPPALGEALSKNETLKVINLSDQFLHGSIMRGIARMKNLTSLNLNTTGAGDLVALACFENKNLRHLHLCTNAIEGRTLHALRDHENLEELMLFTNGIGRHNLDYLAENTSIKSLGLGCNSIGPEGAKALAAMPNLEKLWIEENPIGDEGRAALTERWLGLSQYKPLKRCDLDSGEKKSESD
ncbi:MAG: hypothetical protein ACKOAD_01150 [Gammaproteobacteria bacterium]